jgi:hypothetical protein
MNIYTRRIYCIIYRGIIFTVYQNARKKTVNIVLNYESNIYQHNSLESVYNAYNSNIFLVLYPSIFCQISTVYHFWHKAML